MAIKDKSQRQPKKIASKLSYKIGYSNYTFSFWSSFYTCCKHKIWYNLHFIWFTFSIYV